MKKPTDNDKIDQHIADLMHQSDDLPEPPPALTKNAANQLRQELRRERNTRLVFFITIIIMGLGALIASLAVFDPNSGLIRLLDTKVSGLLLTAIAGVLIGGVVGTRRR